MYRTYFTITGEYFVTIITVDSAAFIGECWPYGIDKININGK